MNRYFNTFIYATAALLIISCGGNDGTVNEKSNRSVQYFPNMYESVGYETYQEAPEDLFEDGIEAQKPVDGTVNRGWLPYEYEDSNDGYASAKANLNNPLPYTEENLAKGAELYNIYCGICHGKNGNGQGHLVKTEKILGVPSYADREITQGSIYHVMYWGINYMGSYASQTSEEERWQIAHHVDKLTKELKGEEPRAFDLEVEEIIIEVADEQQVEKSNLPVVTGSFEDQENNSSTDGE